jgi:hypothetical protein
MPLSSLRAALPLSSCLKKPQLLALGDFDPPVYFRLQYGHRQRSRHQHLRVKGANVELRTELGLGLAPQAADRQLPDLVRERL